MASNLALGSGRTSDTARFAPVDVGMMLSAAARARLRSLCGRSCSFWSAGYAWIVVIIPRSIPKLPWRTCAGGTKQLGGQPALGTPVGALGAEPWGWRPLRQMQCGL